MMHVVHTVALINGGTARVGERERERERVASRDNTGKSGVKSKLCSLKQNTGVTNIASYRINRSKTDIRVTMKPETANE